MALAVQPRTSRLRPAKSSGYDPVSRTSIVSIVPFLGRRQSRRRSALVRSARSRQVRQALMPTAPMIAERALERDLFMTPEQAKEFRLVDHIKESRKEVEEEEEAAVDKANV